MSRIKEKNKVQQEGLRAIVQERLLKDVFVASGEKWSGWMILILDAEATRVISSAVGMYDLMERRVTLVEDLHKKRAPFRDMAPIYLLSPTRASVDRLVADWTPTDKQKEPLYADTVLVYFLGKLPDLLFGRIRGCKPLVKRLKALVELNIEFLPKEARAFHFDMNSCFAELALSSNRPTPSEVIVADKLVTVCATLNEYPHIRYRASSRLCKSLANVFHTKFNDFIGANQTWWYYGDSNHSAKGRSTLLLLDRADDVLSPLMHEFTYQAMVNDLLPIQEDRITYQAETTGTSVDTGNAKDTMDKDALLNDNDAIWVELRGKHIADVIQILSNQIREIVNSSTSTALNAKGDSTKALSLSQMASALKALPEYREVMSKLSQHMHISHQCMEIFNRLGLLDLSDLEQTLATGKTDNGRTPKVSDLVATVEEKLNGTQDSMTRLRLLAIFIVSQRGLRQTDQARLYSAARLSSHETKVLNNLEKLGIPIVQSTSANKMSNLLMSQKLTSAGRKESESEYASSRYVCDMKTILEEMNENKLSLEDYPSVLPMPEEGTSSGVASSARPKAGTVSARKPPPASTQSRWVPRVVAGGDKKKTGSYTGARHIVFVAGGICYSELRAAREVMAIGDREVIVGSTRFINPTQFVEDLLSL